MIYLRIYTSAVLFSQMDCPVCASASGMKTKEELVTHLNIHRTNLDLLIDKFADCLLRLSQWAKSIQYYLSDMSYYDRSNEVSYHHTLSVIILVAFTVLMAALTCLFAYLFDQISGISKDQTWNQVYRSTRLLTIQGSRISPMSFVAKKIWLN